MISPAQNPSTLLSTLVSTLVEMSTHVGLTDRQFVHAATQCPRIKNDKRGHKRGHDFWQKSAPLNPCPLFPLFNLEKKRKERKESALKEYAREGGRVDKLISPWR